MKNEFIIKVFLLLLIFLSNNDIAQTWEKLNPIFYEKDTILDYAAGNFITKNVGWISTFGHLVSGGFRSILLETKDGGLSWKLIWELKKSISVDKSRGLYKENSSGDGVITTFKLDTNYIWFMGSGVNGGLLFSKNMGLTWDTSSVTHENEYKAGGSFGALHFFNSNMGLAFNNYRWFTKDGGYTWERWMDTATVLYLPKDVCFINERLGWVVNLGSDVTDVGSIANTMDGGKNWQYQNKRAPSLYDVIFLDSLNGFAVGIKVLFNIATLCVTKDGGANWNINEFGSGQLYCIEFLDSLNGWIGGSGKILRTTDGGESWATQIEGLESDIKQMIILKKDKVAYAFGNDWNGKTHTLLHADLSNLTAVKSDTKTLPAEYNLSQNYPNPFNPSTIIKYQLAANSFVTLKVYDVLGNEVATLVNEQQTAGNYTEQFTTSPARGGKQLASGMYFYTLTAGKFTDTKKFILLK